MKKKSIRLTLMAATCFTGVLQAEIRDTGFQKFKQPVPDSKLSFEMVPVAAGNFSMTDEKGSTKKIQVSAFWMGAHEVTFDAFDIFYKDESISQNSDMDAITRPSPQYIDFSQGMGRQDGYPVNSLSQTAALMYCRWLYEKTGIFYRLPTEAEWEYACRAGSTSRYPFGADPKQLGDYAWYSENSGNAYHKVGLKKPNAWGLYDMLGNVGEWTLDQYVPDFITQYTSATDPVMAPRTKYPKVMRGGSYMSAAADLKSSGRVGSEAAWNKRDPQIPKSLWWMTDAPFAGFRLVRPLKQPSADEVAAFFDRYISR